MYYPLQEHEQVAYLRELADALPQLVFITNQDSRCLYCNQSWQTYAGLKDPGKLNWRDILHPLDLDVAALKWKEGMEKVKPWGLDIRLKNLAGEYRWHSMKWNPVTVKQVQHGHWLVVFTDIHESHLEQERLELLIADRTFDLQRSNADLQQFAYMASHDLKEPLRKIRVFGSWLRRDHAAELSENGQMYLAKIEKAADRMSDMIEGVLQYSLMGTNPYRKEIVDLQLIVQDVIRDLELLIQETSADIQFSALPHVEGDPLLLNQLFYNLLHNAIKFSYPDRSPVIRISHQETIIDGIPMVSISFADNGIGFEQVYAEKIFSGFVRLHPRDRFEGTGLGLALCAKIVRRHGGTISATAVPERGAIFTVSLPR